MSVAKRPEVRVCSPVGNAGGSSRLFLLAAVAVKVGIQVVLPTAGLEEPMLKWFYSHH